MVKPHFGRHVPCVTKLIMSKTQHAIKPYWSSFKISEKISEIENPLCKMSKKYLVQLKLEYWRFLSSCIASHIHMQKRNCCKMVLKYPIKFLLHLLERWMYVNRAWFPHRSALCVFCILHFYTIHFGYEIYIHTGRTKLAMIICKR